MAELKCTKQELRAQQTRLAQLERYLPTLRLRKALLQAEVVASKLQCENCYKQRQFGYSELEKSAGLLGLDASLPLENLCSVTSIDRGVENVAGVELPYVKTIEFAPLNYDLYDTPAWLDRFVEEVRSYTSLEIKVAVAEERTAILTQELRQVSIRVNLFEKVLIPRCIKNSKMIRIFLGDLQLAAVSQAKIAKAKIQARKHEEAQ